MFTHAQIQNTCNYQENLMTTEKFVLARLVNHRTNNINTEVVFTNIYCNYMYLQQNGDQIYNLIFIILQQTIQTINFMWSKQANIVH